MFACLPYQGPRWYFRPLVEFMLDRKLISAKHILWCLQATTHLPHDFFRAPFDELKRLWQLAAPDRAEKAAKEGLNAMFGVWGIYESAKYKTFTTDRPEDVRPYGEPFATRYITKLQTEGEELLPFKDYIYKTTQLQTQSLRPIHQITLDMEQLRLAQAICIARQFCELRRLCATRVDGLFFRPAK